MNKFKKACEDLATYLNRDAKGIELLSKVTRTGNEIRTELAAAVDAKSRAENACIKHAESAGKAAMELSNAVAEKRQLLDTIASLKCKLATYENHAEAEQDDEPAENKLEITPKEYARLLRDAMEEKQHHVPIYNMRGEVLSIEEARLLVSGDRTCLDAIHLKDAVSNLSYGELAKLGRLVAIYAIMMGRAIVTSPHFTSLYDANIPESESVEMANRLQIKFLKPRCDFSEDERQQAIFAGSKAKPIVGVKKQRMWNG